MYKTYNTLKFYTIKSPYNESITNVHSQQLTGWLVPFSKPGIGKMCFLFSVSFRQVLGTNHLLIQWVSGSEIYHSPTPTAELKNKWS